MYYLLSTIFSFCSNTHLLSIGLNLTQLPNVPVLKLLVLVYISRSKGDNFKAQSEGCSSTMPSIFIYMPLFRLIWRISTLLLWGFLSHSAWIDEYNCFKSHFRKRKSNYFCRYLTRFVSSATYETVLIVFQFVLYSRILSIDKPPFVVLPSSSSTLSKYIDLWWFGYCSLWSLSGCTPSIFSSTQYHAAAISSALSFQTLFTLSLPSLGKLQLWLPSSGLLLQNTFKSGSDQSPYFMHPSTATL